MSFDYAAQILEGSHRAAARLISWLEDDDARAYEWMRKTLPPHWKSVRSGDYRVARVREIYPYGQAGPRYPQKAASGSESLPWTLQVPSPGAPCWATESE